MSRLGSRVSSQRPASTLVGSVLTQALQASCKPRAPSRITRRVKARPYASLMGGLWTSCGYITSVPRRARWGRLGFAPVHYIEPNELARALQECVHVKSSVSPRLCP
jgi:hypothetical protein